MRFPPFLFGFLKVHLHNHSTITVNQSSRQMTILPKPKFFEDFWGTLPFPKPPPLFDVTLFFATKRLVNLHLGSWTLTRTWQNFQGLSSPAIFPGQVRQRGLENFVVGGGIFPGPKNIEESKNLGGDWRSLEGKHHQNSYIMLYLILL